MRTAAVSELLEEWLGSPDVKWEATRDVVAWARDYGDDLERAWNECPRADYLMALAGVCEAQEEPIVRVVAACARAAPRFVPRKEARSTRAVLYAEGYRQGRAFDPMASKKTTDEADAVLQGLEASANDAERARVALAPRVMAAWTRIVDEVVKRTIAAAAQGQVPAGAERRALIDGATGALLAAAGSDKELRLWRPRDEGTRRVLLFGHAARAASSAGTVAVSADLSIHALRLLRKLTEHGTRPEDVAAMERAAEIAARSGSRVYTEGAQVFAHAADAFGVDATLSDRAWETSIRAFFTVFADALFAKEEVEASAAAEALKATLGVFAEEAKNAKLAEWANALRAAIPFASLRMPWADEEMPEDARGALRHSLGRLRPATLLLGAKDATEALDTALAILDASGTLDRDRLAPVIRTVHERMAELFQRGVEEAPDERARDQLRSAAESAREDAAMMERWLEGLGPRTLD